MLNAMRVGVIGCGNIAPVYFEAGKRFSNFEIVACADLDRGRAEATAEKFEISRVLTPDELLADPDVELALILTPPQGHLPLLESAIAAGKHAYTEKPLGLNGKAARELMARAASVGLTLGAAPDTVLGAGIQTTRKLIDDGWIGRPVSATAFMQCPGHESWHPNPGFYYAEGGGPLFDMGPYYLSALVTLLGPVESVCAVTGSALERRVITCEERYGETIKVDVPTHVSGTLRFACGAIVTLIMSFDVAGHSLPHLEIHGTEGSISAPDPNTFGGPVRLKRRGSEVFTEMPFSHGYANQSRGLGVADMVEAIREGHPPRASGQLALHVLDVMEALHESSRQGQFVRMEGTVERPEAMPMNLMDGGVRP